MASVDTGVSEERRKIGVVIGIDTYEKEWNILSNSVENGKSVAHSLKTIGFQVTSYWNSTYDQMIDIFSKITKNEKPGDLLVVYVSCHDYIMGENTYLIPANDKELDSEVDVEAFTLNFDKTIDLIAKRSNAFAIVLIVDTPGSYVLNNFRESKNSSRGKTERQLKPRSKMIVQYSYGDARSINRTTDNNRNTFYTKTLLKHIHKKNADIRDVFKNVEQEFARQSQYQHKPIMVDGLVKSEPVCLNFVPEKPKLKMEHYIDKTPLQDYEKNYFNDCKEYYALTNKPLVSIPDEIFTSRKPLSESILKVGVDKSPSQIDLDDFITELGTKLNINKEVFKVKGVQQGSTIMTINFDGSTQNFIEKNAFDSILKVLRDEPETLKMGVFSMFLGPSAMLDKIQTYRSQIELNPKFDKTYGDGHNSWSGPLEDGLDRGPHPYFCPVGWQRWSFYVSDDFYARFKGYSICYHGTKFDSALSILLSGLKPATVNALGDGIYASPSINYVAHPRYAEVKQIPSDIQTKLLRHGKYVQFALECRVHHRDIKRIGIETLGIKSQCRIDKNIPNHEIEWVIDHHGKQLVDFNDRNASIVCSGIMVRFTDEHPALLSESRWWFTAHLCYNLKCCRLGIKKEELDKLRQAERTCQIIRVSRNRNQ